MWHPIGRGFASPFRAKAESLKVSNWSLRVEEIADRCDEKSEPADMD